MRHLHKLLSIVLATVALLLPVTGQAYTQNETSTTTSIATARLNIRVYPSLTTKTVKKLGVKTFSSVTRFDDGIKIKLTNGKSHLFAADSEFAALTDSQIKAVMTKLGSGLKTLAKNAKIAKSALTTDGGIDASYIEKILENSGLTINSDLVEESLALITDMRTDYVTMSVDVLGRSYVNGEYLDYLMMLYGTGYTGTSDDGDYVYTRDDETGEYQVWVSHGDKYVLHGEGYDKNENGEDDDTEQSFWDWLAGLFSGITNESESRAGLAASYTITQTIYEEYGAELQTLVDQYASGKITSANLKSQANSLLSPTVLNDALSNTFTPEVMTELNLSVEPRITSVVVK